MFTIVSFGFVSCGKDDNGNNEPAGYTGTVKLNFYIIPSDKDIVDSISDVIVDSIIVNEKTSNTKVALSNPVSLKGKVENDTINTQQYVIMPAAESYLCKIYMSATRADFTRSYFWASCYLRMPDQGVVSGKEYDVYVRLYDIGTAYFIVKESL